MMFQVEANQSETKFNPTFQEIKKRVLMYTALADLQSVVTCHSKSNAFHGVAH